MHKTGDPVYVPISLQARLLLPEKMQSGRLFRVAENFHFYRSLRSAAKKLGYYKHIHCHIARHTFVSTCITLGIPLPVTSKLLRHRKLETTLIYANFVDTFPDKEIKIGVRKGQVYVRPVLFINYTVNITGNYLPTC